MSVESIIHRILDSRKDLTRDEITKMIEEKVKSAKGYFTLEIAAEMVASALGVQTPQRDRESKISIKDLVSGLNDVTITGRVIQVYRPQIFSRPDGSEGVFKRLLIADNSGVTKVVLWDGKAKIADDVNVKPTQIVKVSHGYMREGTNGQIELNLGRHGEIEVLSQSELEDRYPRVEQFTKRIGDITEKNGRVNIAGAVQRISPESVFKRKDGSEGKTRRLWLRDSTGMIRVVFWNSKVEEIKNLREEDHLYIMSARVKSRLNDQLELHIEEASSVDVAAELPLGLTFPPTSFVKVTEITERSRNIDVLARIASVSDLRKVDKSSGEAKYLLHLLIEDETGSIRLSLWEDGGLLSNQLSPGIVVLIKGAYGRKRFGEVSLNLDKRGSIVINPGITEAKNLPQHTEKLVKLADINDKHYVTIQGTVATRPSIREVRTGRNESVKVASFELSDSTRNVEVSLWRQLAESAEKLSVGDRVRVENISVRRDLSGQLKLSSNVFTSVKRLSKWE